MKKGQISVEYMAIVGITTVIILVLLALSNYYSNQTQDTISANQIDRLIKEIIDSSESIYYYGEPSKTTLNVYIPDGVDQISINTNEVNFRVRTQSGVSDIFYPSDVPLQGNISVAQGYREIVIEARGGAVWINGT